MSQNMPVVELQFKGVIYYICPFCNNQYKKPFFKIGDQSCTCPNIICRSQLIVPNKILKNLEEAFNGKFKHITRTD